MTLSAERCWGVLPAAGTGTRMHSKLPKQYLQVAGMTILERSLGTLLAIDRIAGVVVALHPADERGAQLPLLGDPRVRRVTGGEQRSDSVQAALAALMTEADLQDWVLVHDAARPCLDPVDLARLIQRVTSSGVGGILAEPIRDTVKQADGNGRVLRTLDRSTLWRAQTPQMFRLGPLYAALQSARQQGLSLGDEAAAIELAGHPVQLVRGSSRNLKITVAEDLELAALYLGAGGGAPCA